MADPPRNPDVDLNAAGGVPKPVTPAESRRPPTPRWVKAFGILGFLAVVFAILRLTGAAGEGHGPGRHGGGSHVAPAESTAVGAPASADEASRTLAVATFDTMAFGPATIGVSPGETVSFAVTNQGKTAHEFTLGDAAAQEEHADAMELLPAGVTHDTPNSVTVQPGETKSITWRFGGAGTSLEYGCHQSGHYAAGMRGRITVS